LEDTLKQILDELKAVNQRLDKVDSGLDKMDHDLTEVKKLQQETIARVDLIEKQIHDTAMNLSADIRHLGKKMEVMNNRLLDVEANTL
jgi:archaellum component FlaC